MTNTLYLSVFLTSTVFIALGALLVIKLASRFPSFVDLPNERSSHSKPIPRAGGAGLIILLVFILGYPWVGRVLAFLCVIISGLGFTEDIRGLSAKFRLVSQFFVVVVAVAFFLTRYSIFTYVTLFLLFTFFIVWTTNLYNFMDGIDGIAGLTGIVGFCFLWGYALGISDRPDLATMCVAMAGACFGFLFFNFPKAKVFMGDVGSVTLGFVFAVIVMNLSISFLDFLCVVSFLFTFYADELVTMTLRIKRGENLFTAHRGHFYQILANEMKIPHWKVSIMYATGQVVVAASVLFARKFGSISVFGVLCGFFSMFVMVNYLVRKRLSQVAI